MSNPHDLLLKILEVIDYSEDKEAFINEFLKNIKTQSILDLITSLPADKQDEIKNKLTANINDTDKLASTLNAYFSKSQFEEALKISTKNAITSYIEAISPTLTAEQQRDLLNVFQDSQ